MTQTIKTTSAQYANEIQDIAAYAAKTGFNAETGSFDDLMKSWMEMGRKRHMAIMNDSERAIKILKSL